MSLKFWLGGARSDKTYKLYEYILKEADKHPERNYLVVVPEQFTLSTQRELVTLSDKHGILNVDVLSFMRLAHRLEDEVGSTNPSITILDDMGKNLILSLLADKHKKELNVFADNIDKLGYITKVKSLLSELMQYGVDTDTVARMSEEAKNDGRVLLSEKLNDANVLYKAFKDYIKDKYTTTEETLAATASIVHMSDTIKNSVIAFDGFTGFAPVQNALISTLMDYAKEVHVSLVYEQNESAESGIFSLSKRTIDQLGKVADEHHIAIEDDYCASEGNYRNAPQIDIFSGNNKEEEIKLNVCNMRRLIKDEGYNYKDFAIITGDLEGYRSVIERCFEKEKVPYFIDKTQPMLLNPFVEYIRALLEIVSDNYSYEAVFRFLKSGLSSFDKEQIDILDNYCLATGVKGYSKWHERFITITREVDEEAITSLEDLRKEVIAKIDTFTGKIMSLNGDSDGKIFNAATKASVKNYSIALYETIVSEQIEEKLKEMAAGFVEAKDRDKAEEYSQIYRRIMDVLDELVKLLPDEIIDVKSFLELVNAGLDEIRIGVAPLRTNHVQIGDLTRSRIGDVKCLFLVGANDGIIPASNTKMGIINEADREFLTSEKVSVTLAPSSKEEAYTQRLYLYMALNKPTKYMYVSYAKVDQAGKSLMPSYLIRKLKKEHFLTVKTISDYDSRLDNELFDGDSLTRLSELLNKSTKTTLTVEERQEISTLFKLGLTNSEYSNKIKEIASFLLVKNAYASSTGIGTAVARALYGLTIKGSVTRLETYANCAYQYFLRYGLRLNERELFSFEARDLGTIFHDSLSEFAGIISNRKLNWFTLPLDEAGRIMDEAVEITVAKRKMASLYSTARTTYMVDRVKRIMRRTAKVVTSQVKSGEFTPKYFEIDFDKMDDLKSLSFRLSDDEVMRLSGRVDRIDTCEKDGNVFVKIIDYKSSGKTMDLAAVYEGKQLQLLVYLNAAMEYEEKKQTRAAHPANVIPAGVLYYHIDDPLIDGAGKSDDEIRGEIEAKLRLTGLVNGDENGRAIDLMDMHLEAGSKSSVLNVSRTVKGELGKSKEIISGEELNELRQFVNDKIVELGREIMSGNIAIKEANEEQNISAPNCDYCEYKAICKSK